MSLGYSLGAGNVGKRKEILATREHGVIRNQNSLNGNASKQAQQQQSRRNGGGQQQQRQNGGNNSAAAVKQQQQQRASAAVSLDLQTSANGSSGGGGSGATPISQLNFSTTPSPSSSGVVGEVVPSATTMLLQDYRKRIQERAQARRFTAANAAIASSSQARESGGNIYPPKALPGSFHRVAVHQDDQQQQQHGYPAAASLSFGNSNDVAAAAAVDHIENDGPILSNATAAFVQRFRQPQPQQQQVHTSPELQLLLHRIAALEEAQQRKQQQEAAAAAAPPGLTDEAKVTELLEARFKQQQRVVEQTLQGIALNYKSETLERTKLEVSIRALQSELASLRKTSGNPEVFQDELRREFKSCEDHLFSVFTEKQNDFAAQLDILIGKIEDQRSAILADVESLLQLHHNSFFWLYAEVVAPDNHHHADAADAADADAAAADAEPKEKADAAADGIPIYWQLPFQTKPTAAAADSDASASADGGGGNDASASSAADVTQQQQRRPDIIVGHAKYGERIYVEHPMVKNPYGGDIWMKTKMVDSKGTVTFGYIQIYHASEKRRTLKNFSVC